MIKIKVNIADGIFYPERNLTEEEILSTGGFGVHRDADYYYYFENTEEQNEFLNALPKIEEPKVPSAAFEAFKQCTDEEKKIIAEQLKQFLL